MSKHKICVYAISKNEEKFVDRWYESIKEADKIIVLDTGSTDNTVKKLKSHNIDVYEKQIIPWRFDIARNEALSLIPEDYDICISLDLDEVLKSNWRKKIEDNWQNTTTRMRYTYNWKLDENNNPVVSFITDKIHARKCYTWTHPVHEVLKYVGNDKEETITVEDLIINHYPDITKSRSSYLPLLEISVKENPEDDRNVHYLGREYMYYGKWQESIDMLIKHLSLRSAVWKDERCASMRFIARCYKNLNRYEEAKMWLNKAIQEAPYLRDPYMEMALLYYQLEEWNEVIKYCNQALEIKQHEKTYINEVFSWDETVYDLLSIAYYNVGNKDLALYNVNEAIKINDNSERLQKNKKIIEQMK